MKRVYTNEELTNAVNNLITIIEKQGGFLLHIIKQLEYEIEMLKNSCKNKRM